MALRTNYKDDIFAGARKYQMVNNPDGTVSFVDATNYTQEGDYLGAREVNAITAEVNRLPCFKKAGGNATSIIFEGVQLIDGFSITFVVSNNNSGEATTINGKPLYKPGTTAAPNLIAGKAVTVWYDLAGDCFFIKASGEGTAQVGDVLAGITFTNDKDTFEGTMPNNGAVVITPGTTDKPITKGYHDGNGYVQGDADLISSNIKAGANIFGVPGDSNVVNTSDGTIAAGKILTGYGGYSKGVKMNGSMPNIGQQIITPSTANQNIAAGYHNGIGYVKGDANLIPANILQGKSIFGVAGSAIAGKRSASGTYTVIGGTDYKELHYYMAGTGSITSSTASFWTMTISGLSFKPSIVIYYVIDEVGYKYPAGMASSITENGTSNYNKPFAILSSGYTFNRYISDNYSLHMSNGGFCVPLHRTSGLAYQRTYNWFAIE